LKLSVVGPANRRHVWSAVGADGGYAREPPLFLQICELCIRENSHPPKCRGA
jgi:hypothetical protein